MSSWPGDTLEEFLEDYFTRVDELTEEQFTRLVEMYEPHRQMVEYRLADYDEEEHGSWRDYRNFQFDFLGEIDNKAEEYLNSLEEARKENVRT